jgi:murein tripeptide amidase MpaA
MLNSTRFHPRKKAIFVSARVHPGEVPGSHVFNGILKFLTNKQDIRAHVLLDNFVFYMVPIINPDGVYRGHYRTNSCGLNLNRYYLNPSLEDHPEVYGI